MKNYLTKEDLGNDPLYDTLKALSGVLSELNIDLVIVGAAARDIGMKLLGADMSKRKTTDLDVAVALKDWSEFDAVKVSLERNHFKKLKSKQKFIYKGPDRDNDYEVDVVPFGRIAEDELIKWPPLGEPEMSVRCYEDVMKYAMDVTIVDVHAKMAPLAGQFLIKLDTWIDRNDRENKDALDMRFILSQFYLANAMVNDSLPDEVKIEKADTLVWGAQWIASEIRKMLSTDHLSYYVDFLSQELRKSEKSRLLQHLNIGCEENEEEWDKMKNAFEAIYEILSEELVNRRNHA